MSKEKNKHCDECGKIINRCSCRLFCDVSGCLETKCDFYAKEGSETLYEDVRYLCKKHSKELFK